MSKFDIEEVILPSNNEIVYLLEERGFLTPFKELI